MKNPRINVFHLRFLAADEFRGRNSSSNELKIASRCIVIMAEKCGLKPIIPNGSFSQEVPLEVTTVSESRSVISLSSEAYNGRI